MRRINCSDLQKLLYAPLERKVDQLTVEKWSASFWEILGRDKHGVERGKPFVIMLPPPNITGNLHLGHALTAAVQDALIRQKRMQGMDSIWIPGFDHAGLATQSIVEQLLWHKQRLTRRQLGREKFIELANDWKDKKRGEMKSQLNRLGLALNYDKEYFTLDKNSSYAVQAAFKQLFKSGIIYRAVKPVYWSNKMETTLSDIEVQHIDGVDRYTRTGEVVEKKLLPQWFVDTDDMAHRSVAVVQNSTIKMIPDNYKNSWSSWLVDNGVQHWCISRQSWWGHRIPAYKITSKPDVNENWVVADSLEEAAAKLGTSEDIMQDPDVLDTWFSSSLLPLTISGWPHQDRFQHSIDKGLFPLHVMETGFDILSYWVSKMVMMSIALVDKIPFETILLHGMICDSQGKKMSKSKGNVIDPLNVMNGSRLEELQESTRELHSQGIIADDQLHTALHTQKKLFPSGIPACGADGLRAYLLSHDIQEEVVRIQIDQINKIRRLSNKIWNIYRFAILLIDSHRDFEIDMYYDISKLEHAKLDDMDQQVIGQLANCVKCATESFSDKYRLHICLNTFEIFWNEQLSSRYIGNVKSATEDHNLDKKTRNLKLQLLIKFIVTSTKLLHPFMPHITEFLYNKLVIEVQKSTINISNIEALSVLGLEPYPSLKEGWDKYL